MTVGFGCVVLGVGLVFGSGGRRGGQGLALGLELIGVGAGGRGGFWVEPGAQAESGHGDKREGGCETRDGRRKEE